jgi:hypothetical protein
MLTHDVDAQSRKIEKADNMKYHDARRFRRAGPFRDNPKSNPIRLKNEGQYNSHLEVLLGRSNI